MRKIAWAIIVTLMATAFFASVGVYVTVGALIDLIRQ
jgi:hypothetical protein